MSSSRFSNRPAPQNKPAVCKKSSRTGWQQEEPNGEPGPKSDILRAYFRLVDPIGNTGLPPSLSLILTRSVATRWEYIGPIEGGLITDTYLLWFPDAYYAQMNANYYDEGGLVAHTAIEWYAEGIGNPWTLFEREAFDTDFFETSFCSVTF